jgi:ABC-type xylose transport system permease subunit
MAGNAALGWECSLLRAAAEPGREARGAALGELLTELDGRLQEGARIPRVCASIATSTGFLCATAALLQGLSAGPAGEPLVAAESLFVSALASLAAGIAGATFCAAVHLRARRASRARAAGGDALVHRLLSLE